MTIFQKEARKMRIIIVRHGEPNYAIDGLTERGAIEAELVANRLVKENISKIYCSPLGRARLTAKPTLDRLFRQHVHISVQKFILAKRLSLAETLLKNGATVTEACYNAGFSDSSRFIAKFKEKFGMTPLKYKALK